MQITVIKVGGAIVEDAARLDTLLTSFARIGGKKVLVHGGGRAATSLATELGIETHMVGGRRITDAGMLRVVTMVYGGLVNKTLVAKLQAGGVNALGLTGADADIIRSHRRPLKRMTIEGEERDVDFGFVGDVDAASGATLAGLLTLGITPVVAPLTHDGHGTLLNTNADTMAQTVATALAAAGHEVTLTFAFELDGVLDAGGNVIATITPASYERLKAAGTVAGGMLPKLDNAFRALREGVGAVRIAPFNALAEGTLITL